MSLARQASTYFVANVASAAFGLLNVVIFTRLIGPQDYGIYIVGSAFSAIAVAMLFTWLRQGVLREEAKADGSDIRGTILLGVLVTCLPFPLIFTAISYVAAMDWRTTAVASILAVCAGFFELSQEVLRARQQSGSVLRATLLRALFVSVIGTAACLVGADGRMLLAAVALAYFASTLVAMPGAWRGSRIDLRDANLKPLFLWGIPFTASMGILAVASVVDRFIVAYLLGAQAAGEYGASVDLVRQALIIPAISASSAFVPIAVKLLAHEGEAATRRHLAHCLELLLAITLPCCIGYALLSGRIGNVILGPDFRGAAAVVMPPVAIAVIFQILAQQYFHIGFFLANRNRYYIVNTLVTLAVGTLTSFALIKLAGLPGAAWSRILAEVAGLACAVLLARRAFAMPVPAAKITRVALAAAAMALTVAGFNPLFEAWDKTALAVLIPLGGVSYVIMCWVLDVADARAKIAGLRGWIAARTQKTPG